MFHNRNKTLLFILLTGVVLGLLLFELQLLLDIPQDKILYYYLRLAPAVILLCIGINVLWQIFFQRNVNALGKKYMQTGDSDSFIEENRKLLARVHHPYNRSLLLINLSVGYSDKAEYAKAEEMLQNISVRHLKGKNRIIYFNNLAYFYFRLGKTEEAAALLDAHADDFRKFENDPLLGKHIAVNRVLRLLAEGGKTEAKEILTLLQKDNTDKRLQSELDSLQRLLLEPSETGEMIR